MKHVKGWGLYYGNNGTSGSTEYGKRRADRLRVDP
jgi:hypothetical protein